MESPCVRKCTLNEADVCLGCGRMIGEIMSWASYSKAQRQAVLELCQQRMRLFKVGGNSLLSNKNTDHREG